jgi:peptidoglycan/LPS O-acetylase OafA/YrhL
VKILAIERLRGVAVIAVYLIHVEFICNAFGYFAPLAKLASWTGVDLFFVISGFVVTLSLERLLPERAPSTRASLAAPLSPHDGRSLRTFYVRRFFRLAPVGACALFLHFAGSAIAPHFVPSTPFMTLRLWSFEAATIVLGIYNFVAPFLPHMTMAFFWSLNVEEQFYLLLPALFILAGTKRVRTIAAGVVLATIVLVIRPLFSPDSFQIAHCSSQYRFDALAAGVLLGLQRDRMKLVLGKVPGWVRKASCLGALGLLPMLPRHTSEHFQIHGGLVIVWSASALLVACAYVDGRDVLDFPVVNRVLEYVGSRSYAIYVLHTAFLLLDETVYEGAGPGLRAMLGSRAGQTGRFVLVTAVVLVASELAHRLIERPCIAAGKRFATRGAPVAAVSEATA